MFFVSCYFPAFLSEGLALKKKKKKKKHEEDRPCPAFMDFSAVSLSSHTLVFALLLPARLVPGKGLLSSSYTPECRSYYPFTSSETLDELAEIHLFLSRKWSDIILPHQLNRIKCPGLSLLCGVFNNPSSRVLSSRPVTSVLFLLLASPSCSARLPLHLFLCSFLTTVVLSECLWRFLMGNNSITAFLNSGAFPL